MATEKKSNFFRHCDKPTLTPLPGTVTGSIPEWIEGTLTRNGPGIQKVGPDHYKHLFDGLAILHRFHIAEGKATYNSRPLESDTYKTNMAAQRIVVNEFGTVGIGDPCDTLFSR
jgi:carotenoid cleavage dioxygenase-like enzyme